MTRFSRLAPFVLIPAGLAAGCDGAPAESGPDLAAANYGTLAVVQQLREARRPETDTRVDESRHTAIVEAATRVAPAVVTVNVIRALEVRPASLWESFFLPPRVSRQRTGLGSGFLISEEGIVLTNEHVVRDADRILVTLPDGRDLETELVGTDPLTDVAVLRVEGEALPATPLGSSDGLLIGEWVVAIGNPFGNLFSNSEPTVTTGVVSATGRHIIPASADEGFYLGMIQTDASINPGNSGGPLVNVLGEVIGVNSSIFSRGGGSEGLGFAIPIDRALRVAEDLIQYGEVRRAWVGFDVEAIEADAFGRSRGVRVGRVAPGSPADIAGLRPGLHLLEAGGRPLSAPLDFQDLLLDLRAGDAVTFVSEGESSVRVRTEALPSVQAERIRILEDLELITVTPEVRAERGVRSEAGALVVGISPELQGQLGFRTDDVIVQVNNARITTAEQAAQVLRRLRGRGGIRIYFERSGGLQSVSFYWRG